MVLSAILWSIIVLSVGGALLAPGFVAAACALAGVAAIVALSVRAALRQTGQSDAARMLGGGLLVAAVALLSSAASLQTMAVRLIIPAYVEDALGRLAIVFAILGGLALGGRALFLIRAGGHPLSAHRAKLPLKPLKLQLREAWSFQLVCGPRLIGPLGELWGLAFGIWVVGCALCAGVFVLGYRTWEPEDLTDVGAWPSAMRVPLIVAGSLTSTLLAVFLLASLRIVNRARRTGYFRGSSLWRELGLAFEATGLLAVIGWSLGVVLLITIGAYAGLLSGVLLYDQAMAPAWLAVCFGAVVALVFTWLLVILPHAFVLPILAGHDCGWMRAIEASIGLLRMEGSDGVLKALLATAGAVSVVGLPYSIHLLAATLDYQRAIVAALLREKTLKELEQAVTEIASDAPGALRKPTLALEAGRYLDALNGFQMHLRAHREEPTALRGQALAYLRLGHPKAREALEFWQRNDPDSPEATQCLEELAAGQWGENGRLYQEAQRRSTQKIGVGTTGR